MMKLFVALGMVALVGCSSASLTEKNQYFKLIQLKLQMK